MFCFVLFVRSRLFETKREVFRESKLKIKRGKAVSKKGEKRKRVVVMNGGTIEREKEGGSRVRVFRIFTDFQLMTTTVAVATAAAAICSLALRASLRFDTFDAVSEGIIKKT